MIPKIWRLSEKSGDDNLGLACTEQGLMLGRTALIERHDGRFAVRERAEIGRLLGRAYRKQLPVDRIMPGLATVTAALNANDHALARIAAVHLRIPDLPDHTARNEMEAEDVLIKYVRQREISHEIRKASPDDPKHPGWPAGTEGGRGGRFRPKDGAEAVITQDVIERIQRIKARRALRTEALAVLRLAAELLVDAVPGIGLVADAATLIDMANTIAELKKLKIDADAAIEFVKHGPYSLEELQVSSNYEEFSSYGDFIKDAAYTLSDELMDTDGYNKIIGRMNDIAESLDSIGRGRTALAVLLDHPDDRVRAKAGAYLMPLMPERVLPILHEIEGKGKADNADFTAHNAILYWEREGKYKASEPPT
jgi:hypothetical protein